MPSINISARLTDRVSELRVAYQAASGAFSFFPWLDSVATDVNHPQAHDAAELVAIVKAEREMTEPELIDKYGEVDRWGNHPLYPASDWRYEVENEETRLGYWAWVLHQMDIDVCETV